MVNCKHLIYFSDFLKNFKFSDVHVAARFCDKRNYVTTGENYGRQKINLNIQVKKNDNSWILKALYGKHLLVF